MWRPLSEGTVVSLQPLHPHTGIVGYEIYGSQVVAHTSKRHGRRVITYPDDFLGSYQAFKIERIPESVREGRRIWQNAVADVHRGGAWSVFDNCQDLVSRSVLGRNGSEAREGILKLLAVLGAIVLIGNALAS